MKDWVETMAAFFVVAAIVLMGCDDQASSVPREVDRKASDATTNEISKMEQDQKAMMEDMPKKKDDKGENPGGSGGSSIPDKID